MDPNELWLEQSLMLLMNKVAADTWIVDLTRAKLDHFQVTSP
jgi:hypothetical protein